MMTVDQAVGGSVAAKLFVLARMAALVLLCTWLLRRSGERWADVGLRRPPRWWSVPLVVTAGFVGFVAIVMIANPLLAALGLDPPRHTDAALRGDLLEYLFWAGPVTWGTAAFGEELLLRGFILDRIAKLIGSPRTPAMLAAVVLQAALFGSLHFHQGLGGVLVTGSIGVLMGLMWLLGGRNLWACIILHGIINSISHYESYTAVAG
ncbi:CPBP family intramembrane glutamic endopeptidase [Cognatilysobacter bugurensis]|nr:CPBP family intramembrane glutamic endopeptidase [Lysobacter bugurensis]